VHDLGPLTHPDLFPAGLPDVYNSIYDEIARVGPHLIFVSETSRKEFQALYPNAVPYNSRIIHPPIRPGIGTGAATPVPGVGTSFLLTVGSIGHRKNQARSIAAYAQSGLAARGVEYVICGGNEPGHEEVEALAARTAGVRLLPYVRDSELRWLYANAEGFVLMSLLEGFGMPVSEAVRHGLIPLVSRDGVLQEVAGSGALDADPTDIAEMAQQMLALVDMPADERTERLEQLDMATDRFKSEHFRRGWHNLFHDMLIDGH
jgi:glycosyltransferase involved in cell wall biosynthesis